MAERILAKLVLSTQGRRRIPSADGGSAPVGRVRGRSRLVARRVAAGDRKWARQGRCTDVGRVRAIRNVTSKDSDCTDAKGVGMTRAPLTYMDIIALAIAVGIWLIFLFGTNVAG